MTEQCQNLADNGEIGPLVWSPEKNEAFSVLTDETAEFVRLISQRRDYRLVHMSIHQTVDDERCLTRLMMRPPKL